MIPIKFPEHNIVIAKNQPEYLPLPAYSNVGKVGDTTGGVIFCWRLSLKERIVLLFTGKLWHEVLTFHKPLQPQFLTTIKQEVLPDNKNAEPLTKACQTYD